jgi:hypothetical protein
MNKKELEGFSFTFQFEINVIKLFFYVSYNRLDRFSPTAGKHFKPSLIFDGLWSGASLIDMTLAHR